MKDYIVNRLCQWSCSGAIQPPGGGIVAVPVVAACPGLSFPAGFVDAHAHNNSMAVHNGFALRVLAHRVARISDSRNHPRLYHLS